MARKGQWKLNNPAYTRLVCPTTGKVCYEDEGDAEVGLLLADSARRGGERRRKEKRAYECERCGYWHLTSS